MAPSQPLDAMDPQESRDAHEIITERHRAGSRIVSSNRGPDEWLGTFAGPVHAQAAMSGWLRISRLNTRPARAPVERFSGVLAGASA